MNYLPTLLFFLAVLTSCHDHPSGTYNDTSWINLQTKMDTMKISAEDTWIHISKSEYCLSLMTDTTVLKTYPVCFGPNPVDDKLMEGDKCTPEGAFSIRNKYPHKKWTKFMWIDYPTEDSWAKHKAAKEEGSIPQDARIGGEIGIHGCPAGTDEWIKEKTNWTLGCISMRNDDVDEVFGNVVVGTRVIIE